MASQDGPKQSPPDPDLNLTGIVSTNPQNQSTQSASGVPIDVADSGIEDEQFEYQLFIETTSSQEDREPHPSITDDEESKNIVSTEIEEPRAPDYENYTPELATTSSSSAQIAENMKKKNLPKDYSFKSLDLQLPLSSNESICSIAAHDSNLYVGTTHSQLFHLYLFEDAEDYIVISQLSIGNGSKSKIDKILLLTDVEQCLILSNNVIYTYLLPELSPCNVGKIRDVQDILTLSQVKSPKIKSKLDKIVAFTSTKIRLLQFSKDVIKLLKDIPYTDSIIGLSSAAGTLANYSNICLVANKKSYDVVDIQQTRRIPLSEFNPSKINFEDGIHQIKPLIVPFTAEDKPEKPEEYLLSICSDSTSSMALFVNAEGDVIRGTLIWFEEGCPTGGLSVEWPFVVGIFWNDRDKTERLCISSLTSLETVFVDEVLSVFQGSFSKVGEFSVKKVEPAFSVLDKELLDILQLVSFIDKSPVQSSKQYKKASIAIVGGSSCAYLDRRSSLSSELESILQNLQDNTSEKELNICCEKLKQLSNKNEKIWPIFIASLLLAGQLEEVKSLFKNQDKMRMIDPRLLLSWCEGIVDDATDFWKEYFVTRCVSHLHGHRKRDAGLEFRTWIIEETYRRRESYGEEINSQIREYCYTMSNKSTSALIELAESEKELWIAQNRTSDKLLSYFEENHYYLLLIHLYSLKRREGNSFKNWAHLIIELGLGILAGRKELNESDERYQKEGQFNLVEVIFNELHDGVDEERYFAKNLLELLKLLPDEGLALLKKHKGGKFLSCNKMILAELSKSVKLDHKFTSLKIEYSEQAFSNSLASETHYLIQAKDFGMELLNYMNEENFDVEYENLDILFQTYRVENSLSDSTWPKLTWIEFLHLHGSSSECKELAQVYLKLYEVLLLIIGTDSEIPIVFQKERSVTQYLTRMSKSDGQLKYLLELKDYSTAECIAIFGVYPIPRKGIYQGNSLAKLRKRNQVSKELVVNNIGKVLVFYLNIDDEKARYTAVTHVLTDLVSDLVSIAEILQLIPDDFPIWCIRNFATRSVTSLGQDQSESAVRKVLARQDVKFSKLLLQDFQHSHSDLLQ